MSTIIPLLGALGIFLFGLTLFEDALNSLGGESFKNIIKKSTDSIRTALLVGMLVTALLHNSALISLIAIGFTSARLISFKSAFAMILGANIGTTFSGWTIALIGFNLNLQLLVYPLLFVSGFVGLLWGSKPSVMKIVKVLAGFGLLFLGLDMLKTGVSGLAGLIDLQQYAHRGVPGFFILGVVITVLIQSSTLMRTLTMTALFSGIVTFEQAISIIIGANLGTTSTAMIAGLGGNALRKQVAMSQVIFNVISSVTIIAVPRINAWMMSYGDASVNPTFALARFDTVFNIVRTLIFIPFIGPFTRRLESIFPEEHKNNLTLQIEQVKDSLRETHEVALGQDMSYFQHKVYSFVGYIRHIDIKNIDTKILLSYDDEMMIHSYDMLKSLHNKLLHHMVVIQPLGQQHKQKLTALIERVQHLLQAAKSLKEICHYIQEASESDVVIVQDVFLATRNRMRQILSSFLVGDIDQNNPYRGDDKKSILSLRDEISSGKVTEHTLLLITYLNRYTSYSINALYEGWE